MSKPRIVLFDIENNNLAADYGWMICMGWKLLGEKQIHMESVRDFKSAFNDDPTNDRRLAEKCAKVIGQADMLIGHYSVRHDYPYINTRLAYHGLTPLVRVAHLDTWWWARNTFKLHSNRLASLAEFLKVKHKKTPISQEDWRKSASGNVASLKYIEDHCRADVIVLEECYLRMRPFMFNHPNVNNMDTLGTLDNCPKCGNDKIQRRGKRYTISGWCWRYQCVGGCGGWSEGKIHQGEYTGEERIK